MFWQWKRTVSLSWKVHILQTVLTRLVIPKDGKGWIFSRCFSLASELPYSHSLILLYMFALSKFLHLVWSYWNKAYSKGISIVRVLCSNKIMFWGAGASANESWKRTEFSLNSASSFCSRLLLWWTKASTSKSAHVYKCFRWEWSGTSHSPATCTKTVEKSCSEIERNHSKAVYVA